MTNLHELQKSGINIEFGRWSGQHPGLNKSFLVHNSTAKKIMEYHNSGYKIIVGNSPYGPGIMISQFNSRYHGHSIRTIRAVKKSS